jgi:hypothetical protein
MFSNSQGRRQLKVGRALANAVWLAVPLMSSKFSFFLRLAPSRVLATNPRSSEWFPCCTIRTRRSAGGSVPICGVLRVKCSARILPHMKSGGPQIRKRSRLNRQTLAGDEGRCAGEAGSILASFSRKCDFRNSTHGLCLMAEVGAGRSLLHEAQHCKVGSSGGSGDFIFVRRMRARNFENGKHQGQR